MKKSKYWKFSKFTRVQPQKLKKIEYTLNESHKFCNYKEYFLFVLFNVYLKGNISSYKKNLN